uniref:(northern house mosquito) hypothetical protein n=1 Tax=Culex pipiens TaxID=7175 RepID=A0A8D8NA51_CULPI
MTSMKGFTLKIAILAIFVFVQCKAYVYLLPNATNPDYPGECYDPESAIRVPIGIAQFNGKCERLDCDADFSLMFSGCGVIGLPKGCTLSLVDYSKQYPDCCPQPVCDISKICNLHYSNGDGPRYPGKR